MKTTFWILFFLIAMVYSSKPTITFKPFSIDFESPYTPFGIVFLIISMACFNLQTKKDTKKELIQTYYSDGAKDGFDRAIETMNKHK